VSRGCRSGIATRRRNRLDSRLQAIRGPAMSHRGFTLIEVLVAMIIAALAVSIAARMFGTSSDVVTRLAGQSESWTREQNARRWLEQLVSGMQIQNTPQGRFEGTQSGMRFWSHFPVPAGWSEEG